MLYIVLGQPMLTLSIERDLLSWSLGMVMPVMNHAPQVDHFWGHHFFWHFGFLTLYLLYRLMVLPKVQNIQLMNQQLKAEIEQYQKEQQIPPTMNWSSGSRIVPPIWPRPMTTCSGWLPMPATSPPSFSRCGVALTSILSSPQLRQNCAGPWPAISRAGLPL